MPSAPATRSAPSIARTWRRHTSTIRPSHPDISAINAISVPRPSCSGRNPCTAETRVMVQPVRPAIGPRNGQAYSSSVCVADTVRLSTDVSLCRAR